MFEIDFCDEADFAQILRVEADSPTPWSSKLLYVELFGRNAPSSCVGAFALTGGRRLLGYGVVSFSEKIPLISNIVVANEHRRKGIGSQILLALCDTCEVHGFTKVNLRVRTNNSAAHALYSMFGFEEGELTENYYHDGESALLMFTSLPVHLPGEDFDESDKITDSS